MFHDNEIRRAQKGRTAHAGKHYHTKNYRTKHYRTDHLTRCTPRPATAAHAHPIFSGRPLTRTATRDDQGSTSVDDPRWATHTIDDYDREVERPGEVATIVSVLAFLALIAILA